jgi:hypothetical protein
MILAHKIALALPCPLDHGWQLLAEARWLVRSPAQAAGERRVLL